MTRFLTNLRFKGQRKAINTLVGFYKNVQISFDMKFVYLTHLLTHTHMLIHSHTYTHSLTHIHSFTHTHTLIHSHTYTHSLTHIHSFAHTHTLIHSHTYAHSLTHIRSFTHTYTHLLTHNQLKIYLTGNFTGNYVFFSSIFYTYISKQDLFYSFHSS